MTGIVANIRLGLVWRDFVLEDGRVIPEHRVLHRPQPPPWRDPQTVSSAERIEWERRLIANAAAGVARDKDQAFWADLLQYAVYTYLRFAKISGKRPTSNSEELADPRRVFDLLQASAHPNDPANYGLTAHELQIIYDVADGYSNKEIAERHKISTATVKHHLTNIFDKVGVTTRLELAIFAMNRLPWLRARD